MMDTFAKSFVLDKIAQYGNIQHEEIIDGFIVYVLGNGSILTLKEGEYRIDLDELEAIAWQMDVDRWEFESWL